MFPLRVAASFLGKVCTLGLFHGLFCMFGRKALGFLFAGFFLVKVCLSFGL